MYHARMEYRNLGSSGLKVSTLCLGAMTFGEADEKSFMHEVGCDEATAHAIMDRALDAGVNFIDTADVYGQDGLSERVIGTLVRRAPSKRDEVVLATKFRFRMGEGPNGTRRLALPHRARRRGQPAPAADRPHRPLPDPHAGHRHARGGDAARARRSGARRARCSTSAASNYAAYRLVDSLWIARSQQPRALRRAAGAVQPGGARPRARARARCASKFGLGILPWSPLAGGFLTGKYRKDQPPPAGSRLDEVEGAAGRASTRRATGGSSTRVKAVAARAQADAARRSRWRGCWPEPAVTSRHLRRAHLEQLEDNLKAAELKLPADAMQQLDEASRFELGYPYDFMRRIQGRW